MLCIYAICIVYTILYILSIYIVYTILYILSIYHVYVDLWHIPICLAQSHVKYKNDQFFMQSIIYGVYTLSMPVLSLTYTYDI
jgi:hypothetical protein